MTDDVVPFPQRRGRPGEKPDSGKPAAFRGRVKRGTELPDELRVGLGFDYEDHERTRPAIIRVAGAGGEASELIFQTGRKFWVDDDRTIRGRALFGCFHRADGQIGAMRLEEWHPSPGLSGDEFIEGMDQLSFASSKISLVLADAWEMEELSESGPILEFSRLWVHPDHAKGSVWAPLVEALVRRRYESRFSVLVLKAFPLEYENVECEGVQVERAFTSRQRAAQRLFARLLRVQPLPGEHGTNGWMWRPLRDDAPVPLRRSKVVRR